MHTNTKSEIKTLSICAIGGAFEYYDFSLFALMSSVIGQHFFSESIESIALIKTFGIFAAGYLARFLGGFYFSHIGDTSGRKKPFMITLFLMAIPTFGIALLPTYQQIGVLAPLLLLLLRVAQGFALGGEAPCAMTFVHEYASKDKKSFAMALLFGGIIFGSFFASLIYAFLNFVMPKDIFNNWGWRVPFAIGGILGLIGIHLRKSLSESAEFLNCKRSNSLHKVPFLKIIQNDMKRIILCIILLLPSSTAFLYYLLISAKILENQYYYSMLFIEKITTVSLFLNATFCIIFGYLSDKLTKKKVYISGIVSLCFLAIVSHFVFQSGSTQLLSLFMIFLSITLGACVGSVFSILADMFSIEIRTSALALTLNTTNGLFIGLTPILFTKVINSTRGYPR